MTGQICNAIFRIAAILAIAVESATYAASGRDAVEALVGNTIDSRPTNTKTELFAYFAKDGTMQSLQQEKRRTGKWSIIDGKFCVMEEVGGATKCFALTIDGDEVTFESKEETVKARILPGNPMKL